MVVDFPAFAPYEFIPNKQLVNGRIALRDVEIGGGKWEFALWGKNILNSVQAKSTKLRFVHGVSKEVHEALPVAEKHGIKVKTVAELVEKLKNEAGVI